jgi:hypothetical protein
MEDTKAVRKSDWRDGFLFLGNHLALDFLNTHPVQNGEAVELLPDFDALLRWFQAADLHSVATVSLGRVRPTDTGGLPHALDDTA